MSDPRIPQSKQFYREKADRLQKDLDSAGHEILTLRAQVRAAEGEVGRLEDELEAMTADRNMTQADLELYWDLTNRLRATWWWRFLGQPIVEKMKLENANARPVIH